MTKSASDAVDDERKALQSFPPAVFEWDPAADIVEICGRDTLLTRARKLRDKGHLRRAREDAAVGSG